MHADRAVEHARLAALASVRALLPTHGHPAVGRTVHDGDAPLEDSVRDGAPATAGPHPRGASRFHADRHVLVLVDRDRGRQQRGCQRAPAPREGKRSTTENQIARLRFTEPFSGLTS